MENWDVFISYAREERNKVAYPLATKLRKLGLSVWFDEYELKLGHSISQGIDQGISGSKAGVLILSKSFFAKKFTNHELRGIVQRHIAGEMKILPIWLDITSEEVRRISSTLSDLKAANWNDGLDVIVEQILQSFGILPKREKFNNKNAQKILGLLSTKIGQSSNVSWSNLCPFPLLAYAYQHNTGNMIIFNSFSDSDMIDTTQSFAATCKVNISFAPQKDSKHKILYHHFVLFNAKNLSKSRWYLAHELGHIFLHHPPKKEKVYNAVIPSIGLELYIVGHTSAQEAEADWFASILLQRGEEGLLHVLEEYQ